MAAKTSTRMVIKDIDVVNFKSYAGSHKIGPFHKTFTAVIGPNGSGKSNVIDAMLFVFGKNAKKIRLDKLAELIHNSAAHPNLTHASVTVNFIDVMELDESDPDQRIEVEGTELSIRREVMRSGASQYYIDGHRATQKEVVDLLKARGVDLDHNRFLILQGEVEQIALMKPKAEKEGEEGLLEYFDDLIGTNKYVQRIDEATKVAEECQELRLSSLDLLRKVEAERALLKTARDQCVDYITKDNQMQQQLVIMCQLRSQKTEEMLRHPRQLIEELNADIRNIQAAIDERSAERERLNLTIKEERVARGKIDAEIRNFEATRDNENKRLVELKTDIEAANKELKREMDKLTKHRLTLKECDDKMRQNDTDVAIAQQNESEAAAAISELQGLYERKVEEIEALVGPLRRELDGELAAVAPFEERYNRCDQEAANARQRLELYDASIGRKRDELQQTRVDVATKQARAEQLRQELRKAAAQESQQAEMQRLNLVFSDVVKRKYLLNTAIVAAKKEATDGQQDDQVVMLLNKQKELKGYHGTLRNLGRIADEYDLAAGQASNAWGFHVVDTAQTATEALQKLKAHGMRATFIILDQVQRELSGRMEAKFQAPPASQRLFDLIQPIDKKFSIAFYFAVKDTLVTNDLTRARQIGLGDGRRYRCVTRDGKLVEPTGVIVGGGNASQLHGAKLKASHAPVNKAAVQQQLMELQAQLVAIVDEESQVQAQLADLHNSWQSLTPDAVRAMQRELAAIEGSLGALETRIGVLADELAEKERASQKERHECEQQIRRAEEAVERARAELDKKRVNVGRLKQRIDEAGGDEHRALRERLEAEKKRLTLSTKKLQECKRHVSRINAQKDTALKGIEETEATIQRLRDANAESNREEVLRLEKHIDDINKRIEICRAQQAEIDVRMRALGDQQTELANQNRADEDQQAEKRRKAEEIHESIKGDLAEIQKYSSKITGCDEKIRANAREYGVDTLPEDIVKNLPADFDIEAVTARVPSETLHLYTSDNIMYLAKELKAEIDRVKGEIDFDALRKWNEKDLQYRARKQEYDELLEKVTRAEHEMETLKAQRKEEFMRYFDIIQAKLKEMYQMLTHGGDAEIELVDSQDPFEGINFIVRPPKKSWKQVGNLSGGEKTLSSLALVFALHHIKPTPIYVMDEIDAALDFRNVSIVARYVLEEACGAQFIIISLRNNMFELAHQLVGICKVNDCTRSVPLNPRGVARLVEKRVAGGAHVPLALATANTAPGGGRKRAADDGDDKEDGLQPPAAPIDPAVAAAAAATATRATAKAVKHESRVKAESQ